MANERDRRAQELDQAERWMREDMSDRKSAVWAVAIALVLHAGLLLARMPDWSTPVRIDKPQEVAMKVQFLQPPPPPPPPEAPPPEPPLPEKKKIPRPDLSPDEPEPIVTPPPSEPEPAPPDAPMQPAEMGPIRVSPGQGPGIIKRVEPIYPPLARTARLQGTVVLDAIIQKDGTVSNVTVVRSANAIFDRAAMNALRRWRFSPGDRDVIMSLTVHFKLE